MVSPWEIAWAKAASQARTFVDWDAFWADDWAIRPVEHLLYFSGSRAVYDACCRRQLCASDLAPFPILSIVSPYVKALERAAAARTGRKLATVIRREEDLLARRPPLYFGGAVRGEDLTYVDLEAAYFSIYSRTTLDVLYDGEGAPWRGVVEFSDLDQLRRHKLVRNALLGMMRRTRRRGVDHGEHFVDRVPAHKRRPCLWALVMDCLELVMMTARDLGAIYVHTDGAIFAHHDLAEEWASTIAERFGLIASERARGAGYVLGMGRWRIGDEVHPAGDDGNPDGGLRTVKGRETRAPRILVGGPVDSMLAAPQRLAGALTDWMHDSSVASPSQT